MAVALVHQLPLSDVRAIGNVAAADALRILRKTNTEATRRHGRFQIEQAKAELALARRLTGPDKARSLAKAAMLRKLAAMYLALGSESFAVEMLRAA